MRIFVTGGCGYKGHVLVPRLLEAGHEVEVFDTMWFGNFLEPKQNLTVTQGSVLDLKPENLEGTDTIIHLSSVANDPCGDLDPSLTWRISALATMQLADIAVRVGVKQFQYASSGSVYGVKDEKEVVETLSLNPISVYNETKMISERVLLSYSDKMAIQIIRPATVCGLSPRMRLDVAVNLLTMAALEKGSITVLGGKQVRPNIHIEDICDVYLHFLNNPHFTGIYNAGFENLSIFDIAKLVTTQVDATISVEESNDPRSYRVNSDKLLNTGFSPQKTVKDAIKEIVQSYQAGLLKNEPHFHNLLWMQDKII